MRSFLPRTLCFAAVLLIACGGEPTDDALDADASEPSPATTPAAAPASAPAAGDAAEVAATLSEWRIELSRDTVRSGLVSIRVRNGGRVPHRFEIEGNGEEVVTDDLAPGDEVTMSLNLTAGTYDVYCPIEEGGRSHASQGMRTTLYVR